MVVETHITELLSRQEISVAIILALIASFITFFGDGVHSLFKKSQEYFYNRIILHPDICHWFWVKRGRKEALYRLAIILTAVLIFEVYMLLFLAVFQWDGRDARYSG
jgi:hypothetical protein